MKRIKASFALLLLLAMLVLLVPAGVPAAAQPNPPTTSTPIATTPTPSTVATPQAQLAARYTVMVPLVVAAGSPEASATSGLDPTPVPGFLQPPPALATAPSECDASQCVFYVRSGSDDAGHNAASAAQTCTSSTTGTGANEIYLGECQDGSDIVSGFRFSNLPLSAGVQIVRAYLEFTVDGPYSTDMAVQVYGENSSKAQAFDASPPNSSQRSLLNTNGVTWNIQADPWSLGEIRQGPDVTQIVQTIVNRADWAPGDNALAFIVKDPVVSTLDAAGKRYRRVIGYERTLPPINYPGNAVARLIVQFSCAVNDCDGDGLSNDVERGYTTRLPNGDTISLNPFDQDTDGDGLWDSWEVDPAVLPASKRSQAGFDLDHDGTVDVTRDEVFRPYAEPNDTSGPTTAAGRLTVPFPRFNRPPDPFHKDLYFELDWQDCLRKGCPEPLTVRGLDPTHHAPNVPALADVVDAFGAAPVDNPDLQTGITLNILVDEKVVHTPVCDQGTSSARAQFFGTARQQASPNRSNILQAKSKAFRYVWSGHSTSHDDPPSRDPNDPNWSQNPANPCRLPGDFEFFASGMGVVDLPEYDYSPFGDANIGGQDILVSLGPLWICPSTNTFKVDPYPGLDFEVGTCFRQAGIVPGIFPTRVMVNGQPEHFRAPIDLLLGVQEDQGVRQLWSRSLMHLLGHSLGLANDGVIQNQPGVTGVDRNNDGTRDARLPDSYSDWNLQYAVGGGGVDAPQESTPNLDELILQNSDGDSVPGANDNCLAVWNPDQANLDGDDFGDACDLDTDNDGIPNGPAPTTAATNYPSRTSTDSGASTQSLQKTMFKGQVGLASAADPFDAFPFDTDNDGVDNVDDTDDDGDGVLDSSDNCALYLNPGQFDADVDGVGDACSLDDDNDTVLDEAEQFTGSNPLSAASTPEYLSLGSVCSDGVDNDLDGHSDSADEGCVDNDGDTRADFVDNCPAVSNYGLFASCRESGHE